MKTIFFIGFGLLFYTPVFCQIGKVGINTNTPQALFHVKDSSVVFTGFSPLIAEISTANPPVTGPGSRMMWYADKAAFRVGYVDDNRWDKSLTGRYSFAAGNNAMASGNFSIAMGLYAEAGGDNSVALGSGIANSDYSTAIGISARTTYNNAVSIGTTTKAAGQYATAMGAFTVSQSYNCFAAGRFNDSITGSLPFIWVDTDPLFILGNGTTTNTRRNAFIIAKNGETGINVANGMPQAGLHMKGIAATWDAHIRLETTGGSTDYCNILYDGNTKFRNFGTGDEFQWRNAAGTTIMRLEENGNLTITGAYSPSDAKLKKNISPLQNSLQKILSLGGYQYHWIDAARGSHLQTGLLAQEIEKQMPELVKTDNEGIKSVNYIGMIPYLVEAIKELKQENESLKKEIQEFKKK